MVENLAADLPVSLPIGISLAALAVSILAAFLPYYRRPKLSLRPDERREQSRVEGNGIPHLRALVHNQRGKRSARHARVVLDGYRLAETDSPYTRLGSPFLAWPSVFGQDSDSYVEVIFADAERAVGIGQFYRVKHNDEGQLLRGPPHPAMPTALPPPIHQPDDPDSTWYLHLELAAGMVITDERDWLPPGVWTLRVLVGADDGDARACDLYLAWTGREPDPDAVLRAALDSLRIS